MKPRTVIFLWIIVLALGISVYAFKKSAGNDLKTTTKRSAGEKLIPDFPAKEISSINIADADSSVTLQEKDGNWSVVERDGYKAHSNEIIGFLRTLINLKVTQGIEAGPSFAPRFGMDEKSPDPTQHGITATFKDASGKSLATVSFGKNLNSSSASSSPFGGGSVGRFVRNHADESGFYAVSELFPSLSADPKNWLAEDFFKIEKIQSITLTQPGSDKNEWELERDTEEADFKFTSAFPGVKIDPAAIASLKSFFSYAKFDDVVPTAEIEKRATPEKLQIATFKTFEGLTYVLKLQPSKSNSENYLLNIKASGELPVKRKPAENEKPEDAAAADKAFEERCKALTENIAQAKKLEPITFEVSKFTVDALLKSRTDLMDKGPGPQGPQGHPQALPGSGLGPVFSPPISAPEQ